MTKDNVYINIDSVLYWKVVDPYTAAFLVSDVRKALVEITMTTLRQLVGLQTFQEVIEHRESIAHEIESSVGSNARSWGVQVTSMLIKDITLSQELQENLSAAAKQKRLGESKVIAAQAEVEAAKLMREAADILNSQSAMQIRYLETLTAMSKHAGAKVIFMPLEHDSKVSKPAILDAAERLGN